jgi:hypothetical protein
MPRGAKTLWSFKGCPLKGMGAPMPGDFHDEMFLACHADVVGDDSVKCELDAGILATEIEFDCLVVACNIRCNVAEVQGIVPGATSEPIVRIMQVRWVVLALNWRKTFEQG